jgi:hypothetical protein
MSNDCRSAIHLSVPKLYPVQKPLRLTSGLLMHATTALRGWYVYLISRWVQHRSVFVWVPRSCPNTKQKFINEKSTILRWYKFLFVNSPLLFAWKQQMTIETVFPSPLVPSRKCAFVRSCRELQNGTMLIVDMSLYGSDGTFFKYRKMPSGVLIKTLERNSCKVW